MKKHISVLLLLCFLVVSFCLVEGCTKNQPYTACVGTITSPSTVGALLTFTSCTAGATSYTWTFGDGTTTTGDTVLHAYAAAGTYKGTLTVSNGTNTSTSGFTVDILPTGWTFRGGIFLIDSAIASLTTSTLTATGTYGSNTTDLIVKFFPFPTQTGSYRYLVINAGAGNAGPGVLFVVLSRDSAGQSIIYGSTGSDSLYATVGVSGGKVSVSLPSIEMFNINNIPDSSALSATFTQTR